MACHYLELIQVFALTYVEVSGNFNPGFVPSQSMSCILKVIVFATQVKLVFN